MSENRAYLDPRAIGQMLDDRDARISALEAENARLKEALRDLIEDHGDDCGCWHHLALKGEAK